VANAVSTSTAEDIIHNVTNIDFAYASYLARFGKTYQTVAEFTERRSIFEGIEKIISEHNSEHAAGTQSYTMGHN